MVYDVNQNYINTFVTDIGQVLLDSAKQTFGVKSVNTNYSKKKKIAKRDKPWFNIDCKYSYNLAKNSEKEYKNVLNKVYGHPKKELKILVFQDQQVSLKMNITQAIINNTCISTC
jgi:hypothetical protein